MSESRLGVRTLNPRGGGENWTDPQNEHCGTFFVYCFALLFCSAFFHPRWWHEVHELECQMAFSFDPYVHSKYSNPQDPLYMSTQESLIQQVGQKEENTKNISLEKNLKKNYNWRRWFKFLSWIFLKIHKYFPRK